MILIVLAFILGAFFAFGFLALLVFSSRRERVNGVSNAYRQYSRN